MTQSQPSPSMESVPTTHDLKVWPEYFAALLSGEKTFEFREDDREPRFAVGDMLRLREWTPAPAFPSGGMYLERETLRRVAYVARGGVIPEGFCVMSLVECGPGTETPRGIEPDVAEVLMAEIEDAASLWVSRDTRDSFLKSVNERICKLLVRRLEGAKTHEVGYWFDLHAKTRSELEAAQSRIAPLETRRRAPEGEAPADTDCEIDPPFARSARTVASPPPGSTQENDR